MIEVDSHETVLSLRPDFELLKSADPGRFIITAKSDLPQYDFFSRFFAPGVGIAEDPVTGSAHCCLASYWGKNLGKKTLTGFQASERNGIIECELIDYNRILLRGNVVIMSEMIPYWK